ncbi:MAG: serine hydrolase domain-containing protein [Panacibacter sp.]
MKKYCLLLIFTVLVTSPGITQKIDASVNPELAGFSSERLKRIDKNMNDWVTKGWVQGCVGLIIHDSKIVYYKAAGYNDIEAKSVMKKDDIFRIASQTKAITSVAVMMLYEEGKFLLDDPVSKYIPSYTNQTVLSGFNEADTTYTTIPAKRQVTIRDLLTHTSGIGYAQIGSKEANAIYAKNNITAGLDVQDDKLSDAMTRLGVLPLMYQPGEQWMYGLNVDLLGFLVEQWSGMSLDDFFRKRIFEPLGMTDTYFNLPATKANRLVNIYTEDSLGHLNKVKDKPLGLAPDYPLHNKTYFSGGGGLSSTIFDYAVFLQMILNGGVYDGVRLLSASSVRMMTMNQIGDLALDDAKFGLGFAIATDKSSALFPEQPGTYSWGGAFATSYWVDPKQKMVVLFYRQLWGTKHGDLSDYFKILTYQALNN